MRQEQIYHHINSGFPNQHDIYAILRSTSDITLNDIKKAINENRDPLSNYLIDYLESKKKTHWEYSEAEDAIQELYQRHHEFMSDHLQIYGMTPKGYKIALKAWKKEYVNKIK